MLPKGDILLNRQEDLEQQVLQYFSNIYASENNCTPNDLIRRTIPSLVSPEDNCFLTNIPTREEVKEAVFNMHGEGAPGPDGFGGLFFQHFWDIVGEDVFQSVLQFFLQGWILPNMNSNLVVLIPKVPGADSSNSFG